MTKQEIIKEINKLIVNAHNSAYDYVVQSRTINVYEKCIELVKQLDEPETDNNK